MHGMESTKGTPMQVNTRSISTLRPTSIEVDRRIGLPSLTIRLNGVWLSSRQEANVAALLRDINCLPSLRITVAARASCEPNAATLAAWIAEQVGNPGLPYAAELELDGPAYPDLSPRAARVIFALESIGFGPEGGNAEDTRDYFADQLRAGNDVLTGAEAFLAAYAPEFA